MAANLVTPQGLVEREGHANGTNIQGMKRTLLPKVELE